MLDSLFVLAGIGLLYGGGEALVHGAVDLARRLGLTPMTIGLTVVAFATSAPELAATLTAAAQGAPDVAVGNVLGSNVANVGLILGLAALLRPTEVEWGMIRRELPFMILTGALLYPLFADGILDRVEGLVLVALLAGYLLFTLRSGRSPIPDEEVEELAGPGPSSLPRAAGLVALGIVGLVAGASLLVEGAVGIATRFGVSERVIGLTMVAFGTSLPELASSLVAARRGHGDIVLGNVIGSNIFNVLCILGTTALVAPLPITPDVLRVDFWVMLGFSLGPVLLLWPDRRLARREGVLLAAGYVLYLGALFW